MIYFGQLTWLKNYWLGGKESNQTNHDKIVSALWYTLVAYIANFGAVWSGFIVFDSILIKAFCSAFEYIVNKSEKATLELFAFYI